MANYKKLTDVEVMEEVSENSMALVNENGVLKQVPCGAGFGGGGTATAIIEFRSGGRSRSKVATYVTVGPESPAISFVCNNMTYSDILTSLQNRVFVNVVAIGTIGDFLSRGTALTMAYDSSSNMIILSFINMPFEALFWLNDNTITDEEPVPPGAPN